MRMSGAELASWRETPAKQAILAFVDAVTRRDSADFVEEAEPGSFMGVTGLAP